MRRLRSDESVLTALCLGGYFFIGTLATLFPSILPTVLRDFRLSMAAVGLVFPFSALGSLLGGLLAGIGSDRLGRKPFLGGSALLSGLSLFAASRTTHWPVFVGCFLLLGAAQGALSNSINALMLDMNAVRRARALNGLHGFYSLGAMLSPYGIQWALGPTANWRLVLLGAGCMWAGLSLLALLARYPAAGTRRPRAGAHWALLANGAFAGLFLVAFLYNGVAWALLGWTKEALRQQGLPAALGAAMLSIFYLGLTIGRFTCASLSERAGYGRTLLLCAIGTSLAYPLATFTGRPLWSLGGVMLSGLFLSGLYPTALAYATRLFPGRSGTVTATLSIGMTLGSSLPPWWTGALGGVRGLAFALQVNYLLVLPLIGIGLYVLRHERRTRVAELPASL